VFILKREVHLGTENLHDPWSYHHQQSPHPCHPSNQPPSTEERGMPNRPIHLSLAHLPHDFDALLPFQGLSYGIHQRPEATQGQRRRQRRQWHSHCSTALPVVVGGQVVKEVKGFNKPTVAMI